MKKVLLPIALLFIFSCKKELSKNNEKILLPIAYSKKSELKKDFSKILVKSLSESESFRQLIKNEALKQFDNDYDVLYESIKNQKLENGQTVRTLLQGNCKDERKLLQIENELPLLTIFVPSLPEKSFSAEKWNTQSEIPEVAAEVRETNDVFMYPPNSDEYILKSDRIPSFPVVVVKECERIMVSSESLASKRTHGDLFNVNDKKFKFLDNSFKKSVNNFGNRTFFNPDQKLVDAFNIYANADGWQRDYIYYNITPSNPSGQFNYNYKETITQFSLVGDPRVALTKISNNTDNDPRLVTASYTPPSNLWTDGSFEFKVSFLVNAKNGIGPVFEILFPCPPTDLFDATLGKFTQPYPLKPVYYIKTLTLKAKAMNLPVFNWDLNQYGATIKVNIVEVDPSELITRTETISSKFAANFGIEGTLLKKVGLKFGASLEQTSSSTFTTTYTTQSDDLSSVLINFADKVLLSKPFPTVNLWTTPDYFSGYFNLSLEPTKVQ
jgi:hypothetical protein